MWPTWNWPDDAHRNLGSNLSTRTIWHYRLDTVELLRRGNRVRCFRDQIDYSTVVQLKLRNTWKISLCTMGLKIAYCMRAIPFKGMAGRPSSLPQIILSFRQPYPQRFAKLVWPPLPPDFFYPQSPNCHIFIRPYNCIISENFTLNPQSRFMKHLLTPLPRIFSKYAQSTFLRDFVLAIFKWNSPKQIDNVWSTFLWLQKFNLPWNKCSLIPFLIVFLISFF